jgi:hypothetical protein
MVSDRRSHAIFQGMDETKIEKLARLSGRVASKLVGALERRCYDIRGKMSAPISRGPVAFAKAKIGRLMAAVIERTRSWKPRRLKRR